MVIRFPSDATVLNSFCADKGLALGLDSQRSIKKPHIPLQAQWYELRLDRGYSPALNPGILAETVCDCSQHKSTEHLDDEGQSRIDCDTVGPAGLWPPS